MPRRPRAVAPPPLPTIWRVPDDLWTEIAVSLAAHNPAKPIGRKRFDPRRAQDGII